MSEKNESNYWSDLLILNTGTITHGSPIGLVVYYLKNKLLKIKLDPIERQNAVAGNGDESTKIHCYFSCLAIMAKLLNKVSLHEDELIKKILKDDYLLEDEDVERVYTFYKGLPDDDFDFDFFVTYYADLVKYDSHEAKNFIESLIAFAHLDGDYSFPEKNAIKRAIEICRLPADIHDQILYNAVIAKKINELPGPIFGSGFFINDKGFIITNNHVITGRKNIKIRLYDRLVDADLTIRDEESDLCLLRINEDSTGIPFNNQPIKEGQAIFTYGYPEPRTMGYSPKLTKGVISSKFGAKDDAHRMQIDAAIQPGNSGGPVIDCDSGAIVGLVSSRLKNSQKANYAIKSDRVLSFLGKMEVIRKSVDISDNSPRDFTQIVEDVNKSTVQVLSCK